MKIETFTNYSKILVQNNLNILFVFGDNIKQTGFGGTAIIRNQPNTIGIPTKNEPTILPQAYFSDDNLLRNKSVILHSIAEIFDRIYRVPMYYKALGFPISGIGTGLANMKEKCPKTKEFLDSILKLVFNFDNL